jgi:hypothetical protein
MGLQHALALSPFFLAFPLASVGLPACTPEDENPARPSVIGAQPPTAGGDTDDPSAGTSDGASRTTIEGGNDLVPIVVAQGLMGRTTISCDDGKSWIANRSFDLEGSDMVCGDTTPITCGITACKKIADANGNCYVAEPCDCVHHQGFAKGVVIARERVVATFGWGAPVGMLMTSFDGAKWGDRFRFDDLGSPGVAYGAGRFVHFSMKPNISEDGIQWRAGASAGFNGPGQPWTSTRGFGFHDFGTGRFIGLIDQNLIRVSANAGDSWSSPTAIPDGCTNQGYATDLLSGNGAAVVITAAGNACRSVDGGNTWSLHPITTGTLAAVGGTFAGGEFLVWTGLSNGTPSRRYSSTDGKVWTMTPMQSSIVWLGPVAVTPKGTLISTNGLWAQYEGQVFMRSTDNGLTWEALPPSNYVKSHGIHRFASGFVKRSSVCPN